MMQLPGQWHELVRRAAGEAVPTVEVTRQVVARIDAGRGGTRAGVAGVTTDVAGVVGVVFHTPTLAACAGVGLVVAVVMLRASAFFAPADEVGPVMELLSLYMSATR
ncbi:MAG: hypothetical protein WD009_13560 [Phycisphaeraceae bacterium]